MQNLFENLNISEELKDELSEKFEVAINEKAEIIAEAKAENLFQEKKQEFIVETAEKIDDYLSIIAEEYANEIKEIKENQLAVKKAETIIEGVGAVLTAAGIDTAAIVKIANESVDESLSTNESDEKAFEYKKQLDDAINENLEIKEKNDKFLKAGLFFESALDEGLSTFQVEKAKELASNLDEGLSLVEYNEQIQKIFDLVQENDGINESAQGTQGTKKTVQESSFIKSHLF